MRKLPRYIAAILFQFSFAAFLILASLRFQILNSQVLIDSFRSAEVYKQTVELFNTFLENEIEKQLGDYSQLTPDKKRVIEKQIKEISSSVTEDRVRQMTETNIKRFIKFLNDEEKEMFLYFPIHNWGLPSIITSQDPISDFSESTSLETLLGLDRAKNAKSQLLVVKEYISLVRVAWILAALLSIVSLVAHILFSDKPGRLKPTAWLLVVSGIYTLLMCGSLFIGSNEFVKRVANYGDPMLLMISSIIPQILLVIINLWIKIAVGMITIGMLTLLIQLIVTKSNDKKQNKAEKLQIQPEITETTKSAQSPTPNQAENKDKSSILEPPISNT